jgi:hypothetical protein
VNIVHRSPTWFWETLKNEGLRFRRDYTPYQCEICIDPCEDKLKIAKKNLAILLSVAEEKEGEAEDRPAAKERKIAIAELKAKIKELMKRKTSKRIHDKQMRTQRAYNTEVLDEWLRESTRHCKVTTDFGASYFINGGRYVCLIFHLKYMDSFQQFESEVLYSCVSDPDERSEDAFFTRAVWDHMLRKDEKGAKIFAKFKSIKLCRDSGPHFQNNKICYFETTMKKEYGINFSVSAFAKRHGWNECDGAHARFVKAIKEASLEDYPPLDCESAVGVVNHHDKFKNCAAYHFTKIDRNPNLFPKLVDFKGIQSLSLVEFIYSWTDFDGRVVEEPGYVLGRPVSGTGPWIFHDFLPHTRPEAWGRRCTECSNKRARAVFHKRPGEPVKTWPAGRKKLASSRNQIRAKWTQHCSPSRRASSPISL